MGFTVRCLEDGGRERPTATTWERPNITGSAALAWLETVEVTRLVSMLVCGEDTWIVVWGALFIRAEEQICLAGGRGRMRPQYLR